MLRPLLAKLYRPGRSYRIPLGPLRGCRVRHFPRVSHHFLLGLWERDTLALLRRLFRTVPRLAHADCVADVGANVGGYTLWFARALAGHGRVHAFEPAPDTAAVLRDNVNLNRLANVTVVNAACTDHAGVIDFFVAEDHHRSSLDAQTASQGLAPATQLRIPAISLDVHFAREQCAPVLIKIDVEGAGAAVLRGAQDLIASTRPLLLIESHHPEEDAAIGRTASAGRYAAFRLNDRAWVARLDATWPQSDGVWGTLLLVPREELPLFEAVLGATAPQLP